MVQAVWRGLIAGALFLPLTHAQRVFFFSFDGLGHQLMTQDPVAAELKTLARYRQSGVTAQGLQAAFPSTTGNSHCALFTGAYGDQSNITANNPPVLPRSEHDYSERGNGFRSTQLAVEPLWVTAARQGVHTVAQNVTQAYPFRPGNTHANAVVVNVYQTETIAPAKVIRRRDVTLEEPGGWRLLPPSSKPIQTFRWQSGPLALHGALIARGTAYDTLLVSLDPKQTWWPVPFVPTEDQYPEGRPLARHFAGGFPVTAEQAFPQRKLTPEQASRTTGAIYFRLWEVAPDGSDFLLFQAEVKEFAQSNGNDANLPPGLLTKSGIDGLVPNGAHALYTQGALGHGVESDRRYLETVELCAASLRRKLELGFSANSPRLMIGYLPFPDEFDHEWLGLSRAGNARFQEARRWGYQVVEQFMNWIPARATPNDHVVITSDHGMAAITKSVAVNSALRQAGLEGKAAYFYNSVLVNTTDWKNGRVPLDQRGVVVEQARKALAAVTDPETGKPVITDFYTPEKDAARFGIGGPAGGDLYFDFAPGYRGYGESRSGRVVEPLRKPEGVHGFMPLREDMLAILVASGPRLPKNAQWPRLKSIQVTPLVCDLLGIRPPPHAKASSPLAVSSTP